jgi:hypothetical protein
VDVPAGDGWQLIRAAIDGIRPGVHDVGLSMEGAGSVEIDWIRFE